MNEVFRVCDRRRQCAFCGCEHNRDVTAAVHLLHLRLIEILKSMVLVDVTAVVNLLHHGLAVLTDSYCELHRKSGCRFLRRSLTLRSHRDLHGKGHLGSPGDSLNRTGSYPDLLARQRL